MAIPIPGLLAVLRRDDTEPQGIDGRHQTLAGVMFTDAARQCGDCSLCCKVLGIPELNKPKDAWCPQLCAAGTGCRMLCGPPAFLPQL